MNLTELMDFKSLKFTQKQVEVACLGEGKQKQENHVIYNEMIYNEVSYIYITMYATYYL